MCPQMTCLRWGKVTLVAFVRFFSTMYFQMFPQSAYIKGCKVTLVAFVCLFSTVRFQMCPQTACLWGCTVTLVTFFYFSPLCVLKCALKLPAWHESKSHWLHFVRLFSTVCFQMSSQIKCLGTCKVTLALFVWLFSTVHFQMCFQMTCLRRGIVTLVASIWFFSTVGFQISPQTACRVHCQLFFCPNWVKFIIGFLIVHFPWHTFTFS